MRAVSGNRIAWAGAWTRGYNNVRYAELLPRLTNVDAYYVDMHPWWPVRGFRRRLWLPLLVSWIGMRYPLTFTTDWRQIPLIRRRAVCDHDDPKFSPEEIAALNRPNLAAVVVTTEAVRNRLREGGVRTRIEVIPQGVTMRIVSAERRSAIRREFLAAEDDVVVGIHQPHFEVSAELAADPASQMYAVDALLAAMELARQAEPRLILWLIGNPSKMVRERAASRPWIRLLGYCDRSVLPDYVSAFDIGAFPRTMDLGGWGSIKLMEYMACGIPTVGFAVGEMRVIQEADAGLLAEDIPAFAAGLVVLARDRKERVRLGERGRAACRDLEWGELALRYRRFLDSMGA